MGNLSALKRLYSFNLPLRCPLTNWFEWFLLGLPQFSAQLVTHKLTKLAGTRLGMARKNFILVFVLGFIITVAFVFLFNFGILVLHQFTIFITIIYVFTTFKCSRDQMRLAYKDHMLALIDDTKGSYLKQLFPLDIKDKCVHRRPNRA